MEYAAIFAKKLQRPDIQTLPRTDIVHQAMPQKIIPGIPLYYLYDCLTDWHATWFYGYFL